MGSTGWVGGWARWDRVEPPGARPAGRSRDSGRESRARRAARATERTRAVPPGRGRRRIIIQIIFYVNLKGGAGPAVPAGSGTLPVAGTARHGPELDRKEGGGVGP